MARFAPLTSSALQFMLFHGGESGNRYEFERSGEWSRKANSEDKTMIHPRNVLTIPD
jgi:hypothetical protein